MMYFRSVQPQILSALLFRMVLFGLLPYTAQAATVPDREREPLSESAFGNLSVTPDGSILVGVESGSNIVQFFDLWQTHAFVGNTSNQVTISGCTSLLGAFIGGGTDAGYVVTVVCGDQTDSGADGQVYQFVLSDDLSADGPMSLVAGTVSPLASTSSRRYTAAALDGTGQVLYLVDKDSSGTGYTVFSLSAVALGATPTVYATLGNISSSVTFVRHNSAGNNLLLATEDGQVAVAGPGSTVVSFVSCMNGPRDLLPLSATRALIVGEDDLAGLLTLNGNNAPTCSTTVNFGGSATALARLTVDGAGATTDVVYVRTSSSSGEGVLKVFQTASISNSPSTPSLVQAVTTANAMSTQDLLASSSLSRIVLAGNQGLSIVSSGPWLTVDGLVEPIAISEDSMSITLTLTSDESSSNAWYDAYAPFSSSTSGNPDLGDLTAASPVTVVLNVALLPEIVTGANTIFLYAQDSDGNIGWVSVRLYNVETPASLSQLSVSFGTERLYIRFDKPSDEGLTDFELLLSPEAFEAPVEGQDLPAGWDSTPPVFTVGSTTYPSTGSWPISLAYGDTENTDWTEEDGVLVYSLGPLENGVTYYLSIRAVSGGVGGPWSAVLQGTPSATCGAECLAGDAGGFCSLVPGSRPPDGRGLQDLVVLLLVPLGWMVGRRSQWMKREQDCSVERL